MEVDEKGEKGEKSEKSGKCKNEKRKGKDFMSICCSQVVPGTRK